MNSYSKSAYAALLILAAMMAGLTSCIEQPNSYSQLPPGEWRGVLKLADPSTQYSQDMGGEVEKVKNYFELPFNMKVSYDDQDNMKVFVLNGTEEIEVESVHYGRDPATARDTLQLSFDAFDTKMDAFFEDNFIEGFWNVNYKENYQIPFIATYGQNHRFINREIEDTKNFDGKWKVTFEYDNDDAYPAIGEFSQNGNELDGTFRTETGDYRYLSGNVYGDKLRLSVFDGSHAFLFQGTMQNDTIYGEFRSGKHYKSNWTAVRDSDFSLTDPYDYTQITESNIPNLKFKNVEGIPIGLHDENGSPKVKILNIMGTWCPNCRDEVAFLKEVKDKYKDQIQITSIAFERYKEEEEALAMLAKYKKTLEISWPVLYGGYANKTTTGETFPFLDKIYSYPTMVIADGENRIHHIHTGFDGPATSKYESYVTEFDIKMKKLIAGK